MNKPRKASANVTINKDNVQETLDKSRKEKLIERGNYIGIVVIVGFVLLSMASLFNDVRGEYVTDNPRLGHVRLSVDHRNGKIKGMLIIPRTHPFSCEIKDSGLKNEFSWAFRDSYPAKVPVILYLKGTINTGDGTINGVLEDGMNVYPITLKRDGLASLSRQLISAIPGT